MRNLRFLAALAGALACQLALANEVYVGLKDLDKSGLQAKIGSLGVVGEKNNDGFHIVRLAKGATKEKIGKVVGERNVHPIWATRVNLRSLPSLRAHMEYLRNRSRMIGIQGFEVERVDYYEALEYFMESRVGADGQMDYDAMQRAIRQRDQLPIAYIQGQGNAPNSNFAYVGPKNLDIPYQRYYGTPPLSGRINGVALDPGDSNTLYVATAGGGIWKTSNGGTNWSFLSSGWQSLATSSVAVSPSNSSVVLAATGDLRGGWDVPFGIMRSTNGGLTWTNVGAAQFGSSTITRVVFHPDNGNIAFALTSGASGDVWRSTDGGVTWAATSCPAGSWDDIDFCPLSGGSRQIYVVGGGSGGNKIYRSSNQGATWTVVTNPTATSQTLMDVACSKTTNGKLWVICPSSNTIYRSTNSGSTWTDLAPSAANGFPMALGANATYNWSQDTYDIHITCGLFGGADVLYCGLITLAASTTNGNSWVDVGISYQSNSRLHNDQHFQVPFPGDSPLSWVACDGGLFLVLFQPIGATNIISVTPKNANLYTTQFYHMSVHPSNSTFVMGGTQDNASPASRANLNSWKNLQGGDGAWSAFDPNTPSIHYTQSQFGAVYRYSSDFDTSGSLISPVDNDGNVTWSAKFIAPLVMSGSTVLVGADSRIKRWTGVAGVWTQSSSCGSPVRTLAVGQSNANRVYAGCDNGNLWRSDDGGATITQIDSTLPNTAIGAVATNWTNSVDVLVGLQGSGGLYRCTDTTAATPTWTNVSGSGATALPASPINTVIRDPFNASCWYVGTDVGAFMTTNSGATWTNMNPLGIGNVKVNSFAISPAKDYLYVATFGRGIWRLTLTNRTFTSFTASPTTFYGGQSSTGTLTLSSGASIGTTAVITETSPYISAPTNVTFTNGATTKTFTISSAQVFGADKNVTVSVSCLGTTRSVVLTIRAYPTVSSLALSKSAVYGGSAVTATATLSAAAPHSDFITFFDNNAAVTSPGSVAISAGTVTKATTITTSVVTTTTNTVITAEYRGTSKTASLTLHPLPKILSFTFNPNPVFGGLSTQCEVTLDRAVPIATQIGVGEAAPFITTTTPINMAAGASSLTFTVGTSPVGANTSAPVTVRVIGDPGPSTTQTLFVNVLKLTKISFAANPVTGGSTTQYRVELNVPAPAGGARVSVVSDRPEAQPNPNLLLPAGQQAGAADMTTTPVNVSTNCVISASYNGSIVRATITLNP